MSMELKYVIGLACLVFVSFLVYKELRRANRTNLVARILASLVLVAAFAALLVPITYTVQNKQAANVLHLLTTGVNPKNLPAIKGNWYTLDSNVLGAHPSLKMQYLPDLAYHLKAHPELKQLQLYGYGLAQEELTQLSAYTVNQDSSVLFPSGITQATWQTTLQAATPLVVQGHYHNGTAKPVKLLLYGLGKNLDSLNIEAQSSVDFTFTTLPKQRGKAVNQLLAIQGKDTLSRESVPFEVNQKQPLKVMVLGSFPDFEYKFLKKWLFENEYVVSIRNRISKDKYSTDFLNQKEVNLNQLHTPIFKNIDVLLVDEEELNALSANERSAIKMAVENGMGLIIRLLDLKQNNAIQAFNRYENPSDKPLAFRLTTAHADLDVLPFAQTLFLRAGAQEQVLVNDTKGRALVTTQLYGSGQVLGSTISATYQWPLAGKAVDYAKFWSVLLAKAARKINPSQTMQLVPQFLSLGEKARLIVAGGNEQIPNIQFEHSSLSPRQNRELPFEWDAVFWPTQAGWQSLQVNQQNFDFYVYPKSAWQNLKNADRLSATKLFVAQQKQEKIDVITSNKSIQKEISKWWFFAAFLIAASFLWYEQRILENK